jgi:hypothetical protein
MEKVHGLNLKCYNVIKLIYFRQILYKSSLNFNVYHFYTNGPLCISILWPINLEVKKFYL